MLACVRCGSRAGFEKSCRFAAIVPGAAVHPQPHSNNNIPRWARLDRRDGPKEVANRREIPRSRDPPRHDRGGTLAQSGLQGLLEGHVFEACGVQTGESLKPDGADRRAWPHSLQRAGVVRPHTTDDALSNDRISRSLT
jgi:hypothetical protein